MPATESSSHEAISESDFRQVLTRTLAPERKAAESAGELGGIIANAAENKKLHRGAFALFRKLRKMSSAKRQEFLFHFDTYRDWAQDDQELWPDTPDMMPDRATKPAREPKPPKAPKEPKGAKASKANGEPDAPPVPQADDERDVRPAYLRRADEERAKEEGAGEQSGSKLPH